MMEEPKRRYILAWDVGIRNLAGCLLEWDATSDSWSPAWWDVLDLRECEEGIHCCGQQRVQGSLSPCKAMPDWEYTVPDTGLRMTACSRHKRLLVQAQQKAPALPDPVEAPPAQGETQTCRTCGKRARWRFQAHTFCATHAKKAKKDEEKARTIVRIGEKATGHKGTDQWKERLWRKLDALDFWLRAEEVFIENQPALRNPTMKSIAETLYCFFMCRGLIDREVTGSAIERVRFISPVSKQDGYEKSDEAKENDRTRYKEAKKFSITKARELLQKVCPEALRHLNDHPKKDDLCDALLLALEGMKRRRDVPRGEN